MLKAAIFMGGLGLIISIALAAASKIFYVYVDPLILEVDDALPGANCGGCGYPGCGSNAEAIVAGDAAPNSCVAAGEETALAIAAILGVSVEAKEPDIARPGCTYGVQDADQKYLYNGLNDCRAAALLSGGMKLCNIGCLGLGTCAKACPFAAITMGPEGLPVVDEERCTGCGTCERECPKNIITLSSVTRRILREYTVEDCTTPCQRACPAGIDICEYIRQINEGDYHGAIQTIKEKMPFPTVIGRICPRPCETECRRNLTDDPVAINFLKRFVADYEKERNERVLPYKAPSTGKKVAVIGGGVQGLAAAFFSARLGHETTVYEATSQYGGLLRSAIASNRLSMEVLDWDVQGVFEMGVKGETNQALGKDFTVLSLIEKEYDAAFLAVGGWDSRLSRGAGDVVESPVPGSHLLLDLIKADDETAREIASSADVVIAGGGSLALDAARRCKDLGANKVTVLLRDAEGGEAPDGVDVLHGVGVSRLMGEVAELTEVEYIDLESLETNTLAAGRLFFASGRFPDMVFAEAKPETDESEEAPAEAAPEGPFRWVGTPPYKQPAFKDEKGLLSKGDPITDFSAVVKAVGAGRRGAVALHQIIYNLALELPEITLTPASAIQDVDALVDVKDTPRQIMPADPVTDPIQSKELELGFTEEMARAEAKRCLRCGLICYEDTANQPETLPVAINESMPEERAAT
ncbi:MAG: RnfABCDGE type electron transport complex subunit B [Desulfobacterales bacterium]|nr:RnfABCDGE type electron transport complex subunit B [Desulfobacterales bacterium]